MPVKVDIKYAKTIGSGKSAPQTFSYLSDLNTSVARNFPGIESFEQIDDQVYRWLFEKVSQGGYETQIKLVTRVVPKEPLRLEIVSVGEPGTSEITGFWQVEPAADKSRITFDVSLQLDLPIPFFLKAVAAPLAQQGLAKLFDRYLANVAKALS